MTREGSPALDEAFERLAGSGFELPNGFVNHGPMACEALAALGCVDDIDGWARRFAHGGGTRVEPVGPVNFLGREGQEGGEWREALGDYQRLPEWIGHFERAIADEGWPSVVEAWVPRLLPGLAAVLFHGAIRTAHAVRAIDAADTPPRRAELARALGYWAARFHPGEPAARDSAARDSAARDSAARGSAARDSAARDSPARDSAARDSAARDSAARDSAALDPAARDPDAGDVRAAVIAAAADGARRYLTRPSIYSLHGVTGAMAVELFVDHISPSASAAGLAQVYAEHAALYRGTDATVDIAVAGTSPDQLARAAVASRDPHQVKLVEACRRGAAATGDLAFAAAAERVTGSP